jgi:hypothetical protein
LRTSTKPLKPRTPGTKRSTFPRSSKPTAPTHQENAVAQRRGVFFLRQGIPAQLPQAQRAYTSF